MAKKYEMTILLTDLTGTASNAIINRLESSGLNIIGGAIDTKVKADILNHVHEIANINYTRPETMDDALNNIDRLFFRIPRSAEMVDISSNI
jgi:hypothetical protein